MKKHDPRIKTYPSQTREMLRMNPDAEAIAKKTGLHITTVYRHAAGMDLKILKALKELGFTTQESILYMSKRGLENKKIAETFGCTVQYVSQVVNEEEGMAA